MKFKLLFVLQILTTLLLTTRLPAQNVVTDWNGIASSTIVANGGKPSATSSVWFAYTSIAVYDAVNAVHGQFQPFYYQGSASPGASDEAAAVTAAHRVLVTYFPTQQAILDTTFQNSLAKITVGPDAKSAGIAVGEAAAAALTESRAEQEVAIAVEGETRDPAVIELTQRAADPLVAWLLVVVPDPRLEQITEDIERLGRGRLIAQESQKLLSGFRGGRVQVHVRDEEARHRLT